MSLYIYLCASFIPYSAPALSERLLGKDFLLPFSHFLLEVMPKLHVLVPHFFVRILQEPVSYFRDSPIKIETVSCKYPNNDMKIREIVYLG